MKIMLVVLRENPTRKKTVKKNCGLYTTGNYDEYENVALIKEKDL